MKVLRTVLTSVLMVAIAVPVAAAAAAHKKPAKRTVRAETTLQRPAVQSNARRHGENPANDVYRTNGDYAGSDPDPRIRMMLYRDDTFNDP
jgi:hypothetical protein